MMNRRRLPSISALNAFAATARHSSITRAANDLALTESAVSRQISQLEAQLGVRLFNRIKKRISLTHTGRLYAARVNQILQRMEKDTLEIMAHEGGGSLEIATLPTVGAQWLVNHLSEYYEKHPDVTLHIHARSTRFFFAESPFNGALYFGNANWPGADTDYLFDEVLLPVGHPHLLEGKPFLPPKDIVQHRLLHLMTRPNAWRNWCLKAELDDINAMRGPRYEIQSMVINAACSGQGVALLPYFLIENLLKEKRLCILAQLSIKSDGAYYFAYPEEQMDDELSVQFRSWLQDMAAIQREITAVKF